MMNEKIRARILIGVAVILVPAAFAWTFVPFHVLFGWGEFEFRARFLQKAAVSLLGFATLCVAAWSFYSGHFMLKSPNLKDVSGKSKERDAQPESGHVRK